LAVTVDDLLWSVNSYSLVVSALLISMGRLGDIIGQRKVFLIGIGVFTVASIGVGLSNTTTTLIAFRAMQGVGTAMLLPQNLAIIVQIVPAERRGTTLGVLGTIAGFAAISGPAFGGLLTTVMGWRWIFFINVPIALIVLPLAWIYLPKVKPSKVASVDFIGTALISTALVSLTYFLMEVRQQGWTPIIVTTLLAFAVSGIAFVAHQRAKQGRDPLIPFDVFRSPGFLPMNLVIASSSISIIGLVVIISIFLQWGQGYSAFYAGLSVVPASFVSMLLATWAGRLSDRYPGRGLIFVGLAVSSVGIVLLIITMQWSSGSHPEITDFYSMPSDFLYYFPAMILIGTGNALTITPTNNIAMREVHPDLAGAASGIFNTVRQMGIVGAVTFAGIAIDIALGRPLDPELQSDPDVIARAMPQAMWVAAAAMIVGALCCLTYRSRRMTMGGDTSSTL
jgi:EmrB/QacA subfamily drug resistance transporter